MAQAATSMISSTLSLERVRAIRSPNDRQLPLFAASFTSLHCECLSLSAPMRLCFIMHQFRGQSIAIFLYCVCMIVHLNSNGQIRSKGFASWW